MPRLLRVGLLIHVLTEALFLNLSEVELTFTLCLPWLCKLMILPTLPVCSFASSVCSSSAWVWCCISSCSLVSWCGRNPTVLMSASTR